MVDTMLRTFFNDNLKVFFEPLNEGALQLSLSDGVSLKGLKVKPYGINEQLEKNGVDLRVENGRVGHMKIAYDAGALSLQLQDVDLRVRPDPLRIVGKAIVKGLGKIMTNPCSGGGNEYCRYYGQSEPAYYYPRDGCMVEWPGGSCLAANQHFTAFRTDLGFRREGILRSLPNRYASKTKQLPLGSLPAAPHMARRARLKRAGETGFLGCCGSVPVPRCQQFDSNCPECIAEVHLRSPSDNNICSSGSVCKPCVPRPRVKRPPVQKQCLHILPPQHYMEVPKCSAALAPPKHNRHHPHLHCVPGFLLPDRSVPQPQHHHHIIEHTQPVLESEVFSDDACSASNFIVSGHEYRDDQDHHPLLLHRFHQEAQPHPHPQPPVDKSFYGQQTGQPEQPFTVPNQRPPRNSSAGTSPKITPTGNANQSRR